MVPLGEVVLNTVLVRRLVLSLLDADIDEGEMNFMAWIVDMQHTIVLLHGHRVLVDREFASRMRTPCEVVAYEEERRRTLSRARRNLPEDARWSLPARLRHRPLPVVHGLPYVQATDGQLLRDSIAYATWLHNERAEARDRVSPALERDEVAYDPVDPASIPYVHFDREMPGRPWHSARIITLDAANVRYLIHSLSTDNDDDLRFMVWVYECYESIMSRPENRDCFYGRERLFARVILAEYMAYSFFCPLPVVDPYGMRLRLGGFADIRPLPVGPRFMVRELRAHHPIPEGDGPLVMANMPPRAAHQAHAVVPARVDVPAATSETAYAAVAAATSETASAALAAAIAAATASADDDETRSAQPVGQRGWPSCSGTQNMTPWRDEWRVEVASTELRGLQLYHDPSRMRHLTADLGIGEDSEDDATAERPHSPSQFPLAPWAHFKLPSAPFHSGPPRAGSPCGPDPLETGPLETGPSSPRSKSDPGTPPDGSALPPAE